MSTRRHKVNEIHLEVVEASVFKNEKYEGFVIRWDSDIGFGEYTMYKANGSDEWLCDSEHMDSIEDKDFIKELLRQFVEKLVVKT